jgi:hypothetical protein
VSVHEIAEAFDGVERDEVRAVGVFRIWAGGTGYEIEIVIIDDGRYVVAGLSYVTCVRQWSGETPVDAVRAFTIGSDEISGSTEKLDDQVTSEARKTVFIPSGSTDWHTGDLRMDLPPNTKTLVFAIAAIDLPKASKGSARYIDDVKARIVATHPAEIQQ